MQAKLFMIPWIIELVVAQRADPVVPPPSTQALTNDLLVDAHRRHFYEILRRQQQINDALLLNNALLHPHIPPLHIPANEPLLPPAPLFNPFQQPQGAGSTSKLGTYGKSESEEIKDNEKEEIVELKNSEEQEANSEVTAEKEGTVKIGAAGVKTVLIKKKGEVLEDQEKVPTTTTLSPEDLEVVQLFKKLNLSKEETKSIVEKVEQVVREKLNQKYKEQVSTTTVAPTTQPTTTTTTMQPTTTITTTVEPSSTTEEVFQEAEIEREEIETVTSTIAPPKMHARKEENLILQRNNLKHHPIKLQRKKLVNFIPVPEPDEVSQGSIKTSLTHLPIIVTNEEEDVTQKATLHKRVLIASQNPEKESDRDLLVDFATGAPLDLTDPEGPKVKPVSTTTLPTPTLTPVQIQRTVLRQSNLPPRQTHHEVTNFERLATDYRRRLENTGDIHKILQKISENAYISLVERGAPRKLFGN